MKGNEIEGAGEEEHCRLAGDLIERAVPEARPALSAAEWDRLQDALGARGRRSGARRRRWLVSALALAAAGGVAALFLLRARPLTWQVLGGAGSRADGQVISTPERAAMLRFSDGSAVTLSGASAGRVVARTADGATFAIERGQARFDVVHRARTRWSVAVGPFEVLVTGTSFDVGWTGEPGQSPGREQRPRRLRVDLHSGAVTVRGALAGAGVSLRAGQRLLADLERGRLTIVDQPPANRGDGAADPAAAAQEGVAAAPAAGAGAPEAVPGSAASVEAAREAGGERSRAVRGAGGPATGPVEPEAAPRLAGPAALEPPAAGPAAGPSLARDPVEPAPWAPPPLAPETKMAAGGASCLGSAPQIRFDRGLDGIQVASTMSLAFTHPAIDRGRSWCGAGSLRVDALFDLAGAPNRLGHRPRHAGEVLVALPAPVDLTGKTVTVHFFVEGPTDIQFGAQLFAINDGAPSGDPKWVGGGFTADLTTGRWWTLTHAFQRENRLFEGGTSAVDHVEKLSLQVYAIGKDRVWTGRVYVDDVGWQ